MKIYLEAPSCFSAAKRDPRVLWKTIASYKNSCQKTSSRASVAGILVNNFDCNENVLDNVGTYRFVFLSFCLRCVAQPLSKSDKTRDTLFWSSFL